MLRFTMRIFAAVGVLGGGAAHDLNGWPGVLWVFVIGLVIGLGRRGAFLPAGGSRPCLTHVGQIAVQS